MSSASVHNSPATAILVNGIDLSVVDEISTGFRADPASGQVGFRSVVEWRGGYRTEARVRALAPVAGDEPTTLGGTDTGPAPEDLLLSAAAQCLIVGVVGSCSARGIELRSVRVSAHGDVNLAAAYNVVPGHAGFASVTLTVDIEADEDRAVLDDIVQRALQLAPIPSTIARPVPVTARLA